MKNIFNSIKLCVLVLVLSIASLSPLVTNVANAQSSSSAPVEFVLRSYGNNLCVDKKGYYPLTSGSSIQLYKCANYNAREWTQEFIFLTTSGQVRTLQSVLTANSVTSSKIALANNTKWCISFAAYSPKINTSNKSPAVLRPCTESPAFEYNTITNQLGYLNPNGTRTCLDTPNSNYKSMQQLQSYLCINQGQKYFNDQVFRADYRPAGGYRVN
jgi:hypothetical protein